ncbi:MAG: hypothetical protein NTX35_19045 [Verrucomicrobia bacterium]|nr:hypothetical protein [Verrucomicrobiota bacterium]
MNLRETQELLDSVFDFMCRPCWRPKPQNPFCFYPPILAKRQDVLVVDDDRQALHNAQQTFKCFGWSPVCFTWNRLERAVSQKGLFIQHLKIEGSVICDGQNRFTELMSQFSVRSSYCHEIAQSCELLHVLDEIPDSQAGRYWAVDVMHVGLRSLGVAMLANHGIYRFSLSGILDGLREIGIFSSSDTEKIADHP